MKNKIKISLLISLMMVSLLSCNDILDINKDPRYPAAASTNMLFASGVAWSSSRLGRDGQLVGEMWSQHYTQNNAANQYKTIDYYNMANNAGEPTAIWSAIYPGALPDFRIAIEQAEANGEWHYWMASKVMMAFDFHLLASFWEKIPFTQALKGVENLNPVYDEGKAIDAGIIALLDEAVTKKAAAKELSINFSMGPNDFVFNGDIDNWVKFAKTLKLKILMRDFAANQAAIQALLNEGDLLTTADARMTGFTDATNYSNPLYEADRRALNTANNLRGSATFITYLNTYNDPRVAAFFEPVNTEFDGKTPAPANTYRGVDQGSADVYTQAVFPTNAHSRVRLAATDPVYFLSVSDCYFMQAEAYARLNNPTQAKAKYDAGVDAAFKRWNYNTAETFTQAGGAYEFNAANLESMLKCILMQKWISTTRCNSWDAFFDINRTGIPALGSQTVNLRDTPSKPNPNYVLGTLTPSMGSVLLPGDFPRRFLFTKSSSDYNTNTPKADDYPLGKKMWWHK